MANKIKKTSLKLFTEEWLDNHWPQRKFFHANGPYQNSIIEMFNEIGSKIDTLENQVNKLEDEVKSLEDDVESYYQMQFKMD